MKSNGLRWAARGRTVAAWMAPAFLAVGAVGLSGAHDSEHSRLPANFSGLLNDYTPPAPTVPGGPGVVGGPYEMHGKWSLHLSEERGATTFAAEMTMETAAFANTDASHDPTKLGPHTHHISMTDGVIHNDPTDTVNWKQCPAFKPPVTDGFVVTGTAYVTGNGGNPPFGNPSSVTICILGGTPSPSIAGAQAVVEFSNFTLTFGSPASSHFGGQAINGVVARCERPWGNESGDCKVAIVD
jgi:hypothetical protein